MKIKKQFFYLILLLIVALFLLYFYFFLYQKPTEYSLIEMCNMFHPDWCGNYPYVKGYLSSSTTKFTLNFEGEICDAIFIYDVYPIPDNYYSAQVKVCGANGYCYEEIQYNVDGLVYDDYQRCKDFCLQKGADWYFSLPGLSKEQASKLPISWDCSNICRYTGELWAIESALIEVNKKSPPPYTVEYKLVKDGKTYGGVSLAYVVFYNPNSKPWLKICNPGEVKNKRCEGDVLKWDECSSTGQSWVSKSLTCEFGCDEILLKCKEQPPIPPVQNETIANETVTVNETIPLPKPVEPSILEAKEIDWKAVILLVVLTFLIIILIILLLVRR
ncbi:MAG: hypothetical protein QXG39_00150 [Candidatus Aenigmatarchaeota archaeon]